MKPRPLIGELTCTAAGYPAGVFLKCLSFEFKIYKNKWKWRAFWIAVTAVTSLESRVAWCTIHSKPSWLQLQKLSLQNNLRDIVHSFNWSFHGEQNGRTDHWPPDIKQDANQEICSNWRVCFVEEHLVYTLNSSLCSPHFLTFLIMGHQVQCFKIE